MRGRYAALDGLRGVAAVLIVFRHISVWSAPDKSSLSFLAVDFFFELSGFVLEPKLPTGTGTSFTFLVGRAARIWPTYLAGLFLQFAGLVALSAADGRRAVIKAIAPALLLLPSPSNDQPFPILGVSWSLFAEFWGANLLFSVFGKRMHGRWLTLLLIVSGGITLAAALRFHNLDFGFSWMTLAPALPRTLFTFGLGVAARRTAFTMPMRGLPGALVLGAGLEGLLSLPVTSVSPLAQFGMVTLVFPVVLLVGRTLNLSGTIALVCGSLGEASYAIYCLHPGLGHIGRVLLRRTAIPEGWAVCCEAAVIVALSWLFAHFIDRKGRLWLKRQVSRVA